MLKEQKSKLTKIKKYLDKSYSFLNKSKEKSFSKINYKFKNRNSIKDIGKCNEFALNKEISFIDDLSLSSLTETLENMSNKLKKKILKEILILIQKKICY